MADHDKVTEEKEKSGEGLIEKITEKFRGSASSSDSDDDKGIKAAASAMKSRIYRLFGREDPVHKVLGGGKPADIFLWRDKRASSGVLGVATTIWVLFELAEYHLLTLVCHALIVALVIIFLLSNAPSIVNKARPKIPEIVIPENAVANVASALTIEINKALAILRGIALGNDHMKFLAVIAGLWFISILGSCLNFLTLLYTGIVFLHTVPILYEKYEDQVDSYAEIAEVYLKERYAVFYTKVLSKIPYASIKKKLI